MRVRTRIRIRRDIQLLILCSAPIAFFFLFLFGDKISCNSSWLCSHYVVKAGLRILILLSPISKSWHVSPCQVYMVLAIEPRVPGLLSKYPTNSYAHSPCLLFLWRHQSQWLSLVWKRSLIFLCIDTTHSVLEKFWRLIFCNFWVYNVKTSLYAKTRTVAPKVYFLL